MSLSWRVAMATLSVELLLSALACRAEGADAAKAYFGHIEAACRTEPAFQAFLGDLHGLDGCTSIDVPCEPAERLRAKLFGTTHRTALPDFIIYLDQSAGPGVFTKRTPVLVWKGSNTPHLFGARDIYALVVTEHRVCLEAHVSTFFKNEPNPFSAVLAALGSKAEPAAPKPPVRTPAQFHWYPLSGDPANPRLWLAFARLAVEVNSTGRITVEYVQPRPAAPSGERAKASQDDECPTTRPAADEAQAKAGAAPAGMPGPGVDKHPAGATPAPVTEPDQIRKYSGDFLAANGFFSNSAESYATISFALGVSLDPRGTALASGGSKASFNGYALAKFYLLRPQLRPGADLGERRLSMGVVFGTGVKSPFEELVVALSLGHVIGDVGFLAGGNSIAGAKDSSKGRKLCPFFGFDYSF
jgi:hypothetical protein